MQYRWITNGENNKKVPADFVLVDGWRYGRVNVLSEEHKAALKKGGNNYAKRTETMIQLYGTASLGGNPNKNGKLSEYHKNKEKKPIHLRGKHKRKEQVLLEQDGKCAICGISDWLGAPLSLQLDHIDGNNKNNRRDNLRCLCPNCHTQTPTWGSKKR